VKSKKKFKVVTLGCRTNQYESQAYADQLIELGYSEAAQEEPASICIVNTCTVTESADRSSRYQIRHLARENPGAQLIVTGCLAERLPQEIEAIPEVSLVVSNQDKEELLSHIFPDLEVPEFAIKHFISHTRAFVKVQDGCNSFCTYCIIPYVRGRSRSRSISDIVQEVKGLVSNGYKEVVLTGINIGDFDGAPQEGENPSRLSDLIRAVDAIDGLSRIRVSSIDPDEIDEDLADAILNGKRTCHSMHVVLQSGSNVILKRMNRKYTREIFLDTVEKLLRSSPDFTFTTDVIVGFPGESEVDFQDTLGIMEQVRFVKVHMFPYSERKRTRAALYPNKIPVQTINERKQKLLRLAEKIAFDRRAQFVGRTMAILTEKDEGLMDGLISGHTENFLSVCMPKADVHPNTLIEVELIENSPKGLIGKLIT
jgi:threonylcarbamoyladenosine tRNA methylthiotransferase MtaB